MTAEHPRVLLLSHELPETGSAGGTLLYRMFRDFPADHVCMIGRALDPEVPRLPFRHAVLETPWRRFEQSRFHRWKRSLRALGLAPTASPSQVRGLLGGFRPQVVVSVMQFSRYFDCALRYAAKERLPLVAITHDVNEEWEPVFGFLRAAQRRQDGRFYRYAVHRLCVSPQIESLYATLYGVRGSVMFPNRSDDLRPRDLGAVRELKRPGTLVLGFAGNLNYGYGAELLRLAPVLRQAGCRLVVYSHPPGPDCAALADLRDCVELRGYLPSADDVWRTIQRDCDAVLLAYPRESGPLRERLYRYHFPSKLPEYLALGMPVVLSGPSFATGVQWGLDHPGAAAVALDDAALAANLGRLANDPAWRLALAREAVSVGDQEFDPARIKDQFRKALVDAAQCAPGRAP